MDFVNVCCEWLVADGATAQMPVCYLLVAAAEARAALTHLPAPSDDPLYEVKELHAYCWATKRVLIEWKGCKRRSWEPTENCSPDLRRRVEALKRDGPWRSSRSSLPSRQPSRKRSRDRS